MTDDVQRMGFDEWQKNPYTIALQKSIEEDYVPRSAPAASEWVGTIFHKPECCGYSDGVIWEKRLSKFPTGTKLYAASKPPPVSDPVVEPTYHLRSFGDVSKEFLDSYTVASQSPLVSDGGVVSLTCPECGWVDRVYAGSLSAKSCPKCHVLRPPLAVSGSSAIIEAAKRLQHEVAITIEQDELTADITTVVNAILSPGGS